MRKIEWDERVRKQVAILREARAQGIDIRYFFAPLPEAPRRFAVSGCMQ
jgi:hypothetical protein